MKNTLKKYLAILLVAAGALAPAACARNASASAESSAASGSGGYISITQSEAKSVMDSGADAVILDVRTQEEYDAGHIAGAVLIPYDEIDARAEAELTDKSSTILVYCRSGNRSRIASQSLADLGYTDVREFGGINTWEYGTVR